jgi:hypothetical protein
MTRDRPVVLVVGAASRDLVPDDPRGWRLGGAVMFCSLALAHLGIEVRAMVGADAEAADSAELGLCQSAGVAVAVASLASGPVFDNPQHILHSTADRIPLTALPRLWTSGNDGVLFVPVAGEIGDDWAVLAEHDPRPIMGLGWQGLLRHLAGGEIVRPRPPSASALARSARLVVMSRDDAVPGTLPQDMALALDPAARLVWTEGAEGGLVIQPGNDGRRLVDRYEAIPSGAVVDATGAGDVFLAAMFAAMLVPGIVGPRGDDTTFAAAAASLVVEAPGLAGVPDLAAVRARMTRAPSLASRRPSAVSSLASGRPSQA